MRKNATGTSRPQELPHAKVAKVERSRLGSELGGVGVSVSSVATTAFCRRQLHDLDKNGISDGLVSQKASACAALKHSYGPLMPLTSSLATQLRRLSAREKAALADHLWREAEAKIGPTAAQLDLLDSRAAKAQAHPEKLRPLGDAVRRLRR